jgi:sugar phosphate isomerase/epimerase
MMRRREFLIGAAIAAGGVRSTWGQGSDKAKRARIGSMTANFDRVVKDSAHPDDPNRTLDLLDLPQMYAERLGVHYIEPTCAHFASTEKEYLDELKARVKKAGLEFNQISLGALATAPGARFPLLSISAPERTHRVQAIDLIKQWINHSAYLGCPRVMVHQGELPDAVRKETIEAMKIVTDYGKSKNVKATIELRGSDWRVIMDVLKGAGAWSNCHTQNPPEALHAMLPISSGSMHVTYGGGGRGRGGNRGGNEPAPDPGIAFHNAMQLVKEAGYKGIYSIEHSGPDPYAAVQTVVEALVKEI